MTQHHPISRRWISETAAALLLALPAALVAVPAEAGLFPSGMVYPRAAVSSDAYRTPPQLLSSTAARPLEVHHRGQTPAQQPVRDMRVTQVDHQQVQQATGSAGGYSVQAELQRLYAEEGREMPQMAMPSYRPASNTAHAAPAAGSRAAQPARVQREERSSGLLAGLFDFGRSRNTQRSSGVITQPPVEPQPFSPPTYRQQQARQQPAQQRPATQTPQQRMANSPSQQQHRQQQPTAQTAQSNSVIELQRIAPQRNLAGHGEEFFPEDAATAPETAAVAGRASLKMPGESIDELAEFFPGDVTASVASSAAVPGADIAKEETTKTDAARAETAKAETTKEKMQQLFQQQSQSGGDGFQMPVETEQEIVADPSPAAASAIATTTVTPVPAEGPSEPAPFFADEERAIDPNESMEVSPLVGQTFDPSGADSRVAAGRASDAQAAGSSMQQIAARDGVGLKGYCAVALRDERRLADGKAAYVSYYQGRAYYFSSVDAKDRFDASPSDYAPASGGEDVTMKTLTGEVIEGSLDHSVWYKGRLYLFHTAENLKTFMAAPSAMAITR
jgi:YHS domain-containing protein